MPATTITTTTKIQRAPHNCSAPEILLVCLRQVTRGFCANCIGKVQELHSALCKRVQISDSSLIDWPMQHLLIYVNNARCALPLYAKLFRFVSIYFILPFFIDQIKYYEFIFVDFDLEKFRFTWNISKSDPKIAKQLKRKSSLKHVYRIWCITSHIFTGFPYKRFTIVLWMKIDRETRSIQCEMVIIIA